MRVMEPGFQIDRQAYMSLKRNWN